MGGGKKPYCAYRAVVFFFLLGLAAAPVSGQGERIQSIAIEGARHFSRRQIKDVMYTPFPSWFSRLPFIHLPRFDPRELADDLESINNLYRGAGYYNAAVSSSVQEAGSGKTVRIIIRIREGPPTLVESVDITISPENRNINRETLAADMTLREDMIFTEKDYDRSIQNIITRCLNSGYPQAQVTRSARVYRERSRARIVFTVLPGEFHTFGLVTVAGNERIQLRHILQEITIVRGAPMSRAEMDESQKHIFALGLFRSVVIASEEMKTEEVPIVVRVEEAPLRRLVLGAGYGTEDNFRARAEWTRKYLWNRPLTLHLALRYSSIMETASADVFKPYFLNRMTSLTLYGGFEREHLPTYVNERIAGRLRAVRNYTREFQVSLGYNLEIDRPLSVSPLQQSPANTRPGEFYFISSLLGGVSHDTVGGDLNPARGEVESILLETASYYLGSQIDYIRAVAEARRFVPLGADCVGAVRGVFGLIEPRRYTSVIPLFKRFYTGGGNSVRGYGYRSLGPVDASGQPAGGNYLVEANLEFRFPTGIRHFNGVLFLDGGNVFATWTEARRLDLKYGTGVGVRYDTPIGPVRADLAFPVDPFPEIDLRAPAIYFSLGQAF